MICRLALSPGASGCTYLASSWDAASAAGTSDCHTHRQGSACSDLAGWHAGWEAAAGQADEECRKGLLDRADQLLEQHIEMLQCRNLDLIFNGQGDDLVVPGSDGASFQAFTLTLRVAPRLPLPFADVVQASRWVVCCQPDGSKIQHRVAVCLQHRIVWRLCQPCQLMGVYLLPECNRIL